jgi:hypothetical protein
MSTEVDPFAEDDAAYVLGALDDADRRAFEAHLVDCPACSTSVSELSAMPSLLDRVAVERVLQPEPEPERPSDLTLHRLLAVARKERRRRAAWQVLSGAVAASVVALAVVLGIGGSEPPEPTGVTIAMSEVRDAPVTGSLLVSSVEWGTKVTLECRWVGHGQVSTPGGREVYRLVAVPRDGGDRQVLAQWAVWPGQDATVVGSTELTEGQISRFELTTVSSDDVLLRAGDPRTPTAHGSATSVHAAAVPAGSPRDRHPA